MNVRLLTKGTPMTTKKSKQVTTNQILSLSGLEGGQFGTLEVIAVDRHHVEIDIGNDFVILRKHDWLRLRMHLDAFFGTSDVKVVLEKDGEVVIIGDVVDEVAEEFESEPDSQPEPPPPPPPGARRPRRRGRGGANV